MRIVLAMALLGFLVSVGAGPAAASKRDEAEAAVQATLTRLNVDPARIKSIYIAPMGFARDMPVHSYIGWISFTDCRGNLVVDLTQTNAVRTLYTTGDCEVPGVD